MRYARDVLVAYEPAPGVAELAVLAKGLDDAITQLTNGGTAQEAMIKPINVHVMEIKGLRSVLRDENMRPIVRKSWPMKLVISNTEITFVLQAHRWGSKRLAVVYLIRLQLDARR